MNVEKRGVKRQADESSLSGDDLRFAKRFNLLNLNSPGVNSYSHLPVQVSQHDVQSTVVADGGMQVDDTKHRVYIGNLDAELAEIEAHEPRERLIFLPDIEKHFSRVPHQVLADRKTESPEEQQLVLYEVPKSVTDDRGHDSVRKAILDARRRAQEQATERARIETIVSPALEHDKPGDDAMDIE